MSGPRKLTLHKDEKGSIYTKLNTGAVLPAIGYGVGGVSWSRSGDAKAKKLEECVELAIRSGYRHIDTAAIYGTEPQVGNAVAKVIKEGVVSREELFITTKLWHERHGRDNVRPALLESLAKLKMDYVDLYLVHTPFSTVPLHETWEGMEQVYKEGLAKAIGVSNFSLKKLGDLLPRVTIRPAVHQIEVHPGWRNDDLISHAHANGIVPTAYFPLGGARPDCEKLWENETVKRIAQKVGKNPGQVLLRWGLQHGCAVLPTSENAERIKGNLDVADWSLSDEDYDALCRISPQKKRITFQNLLSDDGPFKSFDDLWDEKLEKVNGRM
jgi:diketogulonate reductase-like aldo/keto reductase